MKHLSINQIPSKILNEYNANKMVIITSEALGKKILGTTNFSPQCLQEISGFETLNKFRKEMGLFSITMTIMELNENLIRQSTDGFENRFQIVAELEALLRYLKRVYIVYVITHNNFKPLEELNISIGGDCYRTGDEIKDLESVLNRTKDLAEAMLRKGVMIFPDIPALHGGKKGEWIILDEKGNRISEISEKAIVALGTSIIPPGIKFLNDYKEMKAIEKGIFPYFPKLNYIRPDTASPDVLSGPNWSKMCKVWAKREGINNLSWVTCLPDTLGGPLDPSQVPTAYGLTATIEKLKEYRFPQKDNNEISFLLEALGGVGQATVKFLKDKGFEKDKIFAFDKSADTCNRVRDKYGIQVSTMTNEEFYRRLSSENQFDIWINNGEGDDTRPEHIQKLIDCGVQIFCGAANNFLKRSDKENVPGDESLKKASLEKIFKYGRWAWPDEAASGGGWTLAVLDALTRSKGKKSNTLKTKNHIRRIIKNSNQNLVKEIVGKLRKDERKGEIIWDKVERVINKRVKETLGKDFKPPDILREADVTKWKLTERNTRNINSK